MDSCKYLFFVEEQCNTWWLHRRTWKSLSAMGCVLFIYLFFFLVVISSSGVDLSAQVSLSWLPRLLCPDAHSGFWLILHCPSKSCFLLPCLMTLRLQALRLLNCGVWMFFLLLFFPFTATLVLSWMPSLWPLSFLCCLSEAACRSLQQS